jgi:site-specific DNA recombinase
MPPTQVALSARVSSEQHAEAQPSARQVAVWRERVAADGLTRSEAMECLDDGDSGAPRGRPALERRRAVIAAGSGDRLSIHSPERLARQDASPVVLVDALRRAGGAVLFLHRAVGHRPADDLLLQGLMAADERAKILARHRRGQRHAAHVGAVNGLSGAPSGSRYGSPYEGGGPARSEMLPDDARGGRQVCAWGRCDRLTIGAGWRWRTPAREGTRTGKAVWERRVVWGLWNNPASQGPAAFGKTRQGPRRPRLRAQRPRPVPPRRAVSTTAGPPAAWRTIPVPARVAPAVCAAVQAQLQENQRPARPSSRGARSLLPGWLQCPPGGDACYGTRLRPSARTGNPRA